MRWISILRGAEINALQRGKSRSSASVLRGVLAVVSSARSRGLGGDTTGARRTWQPSSAQTETAAPAALATPRLSSPCVRLQLSHPHCGGLVDQTTASRADVYGNRLVGRAGCHAIRVPLADVLGHQAFHQPLVHPLPASARQDGRRTADNTVCSERALSVASVSRRPRRGLIAGWPASPAARAAAASPQRDRSCHIARR